MNSILQEEIMAIIPQYVPNKGNCTIIYAKGKEPIVIEKSIKATIQTVYKYFMMDLKEVKKRYSSLISSPNFIPIPLSRKDIFIPIKTRKPILKNDGAMGYFNMSHIKKIIKCDNSTIIQLIDNTKIECLCNISTVNKHIKDGKIVSRCFYERSMSVAESDGLYESKIIYDNKDSKLVLYMK